MPEQISDSLVILNNEGTNTITLDGNAVTVTVGATGHEGRLSIRNANNQEALRFNTGGNAALGLGAAGAVGALGIFDENNLQVLLFSGSNAGLDLGAAGKGSVLRIMDEGGEIAFFLDSHTGRLVIGTPELGKGGHLEIFDNDGHRVLHFDSHSAILNIGADRNGGDLQIRDGSGRTVFTFNSNNAGLFLGASGNEGDLVIRDATGATSIRLDGATGIINSTGADVAERFPVTEGAMVDPGTVMVLGKDGTIEPCAKAYDKKVVGVVAGAGRHNPGLILNANKEPGHWVPVSAVGKVCVKADASFGNIEIGDLLTTSPTPGHAMKTDDPLKAFGSTLGKVLSPLKAGRGTIDMITMLR